MMKSKGCTSDGDNSPMGKEVQEARLGDDEPGQTPVEEEKDVSDGQHKKAHIDHASKKHRGNDDDVHSKVSAGDPTHTRGVSRRSLGLDDISEIPPMGSLSYGTSTPEALTTALLRSEGEFPVAASRGSIPISSNAADQHAHILRSRLSASSGIGSEALALLMNDYYRDSLGRQGTGLLLNPSPPLDLGLTHPSPFLGLSGDHLPLASVATTLSNTLPLTSALDTSTILQRERLLALAAMRPSLLEYQATGLIHPVSMASVYREPTQRIRDIHTLPTTESSSSTSLSEQRSSGLRSLTSALAQSVSGRDNSFLGNDGQQRYVLPPLPPCDEGSVKHHSERVIVPLATDEDGNWLSEFLCFVRSDLIEVFRAGEEDVASRNNSKKITYGQIGIRCRFCAHLPYSDRSSRSSSFPSSVSRIYQSLTMMLRDHFPKCKSMPESKKAMFLTLKAKTTQGATDSKRYWIDSAKKLGMVDTAHGIVITKSSQAAALATPPFGTGHDTSSVTGTSLHRGSSHELEGGPPVLVVMPEDRQLVSEYLYVLMSQVQRVYLTESERVGNRKNLEVGLPGLGCRHCCPTSRKGLCRLFPARRRALPSKVKDLHDHFRRCTLCPEDIKSKLSSLKVMDEGKASDNEGLKTFFDRVWARLHSGSPGGNNRKAPIVATP